MFATATATATTETKPNQTKQELTQPSMICGTSGCSKPISTKRATDMSPTMITMINSIHRIPKLATAKNSRVVKKLHTTPIQ